MPSASVDTKQRERSKAFALAYQMKRCSPLGLAGVKQMVNIEADLEFDDAITLNEKLCRPLEATWDRSPMLLSPPGLTG